MNCRRKLIAASLGGAAVSSKGVWISPVVSSVLLPAHAVTSIDILARLAGVWRVRYIVENNPEQSITGHFGTEFQFEIFSDGSARLISGLNSYDMELFEFQISRNQIGWRGHISNCCSILMGGTYNTHGDEIVGGKNVGLGGADFFVANKI